MKTAVVPAKAKVHCKARELGVEGELTVSKYKLIKELLALEASVEYDTTLRECLREKIEERQARITTVRKLLVIDG